MKQNVIAAQYLQIALDIAGRIASGELKEGSKMYGRSVMSSEYNVSPETIRKALRLLADMKVVEVRPRSAAVVLSADSARRYIAKFEGNIDNQSIRRQLRDIVDEYTNLGKRTTKLVQALIQGQESFAAAGEPLPNYEVTVPEKSYVIGKSIGELNFWQSTGGTIVAIRRKQNVILSPGPYAELFAGDVVILVGSPSSAENARRLISSPEEE
ncbi:MAG: TrkA C-terminal domain-containing protein [Candidatus Limivicinus sp.]|jgi:K+/H+ antiporter YhaU regulatory subunit KhtT